MGYKYDLTGKRFGRLTVVEYVGTNSKRLALWRCKCDCGNKKIVPSRYLMNGHVQSCGCYAYESQSKHGKEYAWKMAEANKKHLGVNDRLYGVWANMKTRCLNKRNAAYERYGARGITICEDWMDYAKFREWSLASGYDETAESHGCTLDRIDNDKGYSPENCRWVDAKTQANNRGEFNVMLEYCGEVHNMAQWAEILGIKREVIRNRIKHLGWDVERALTTPVRQRP